MLQFRILAKIQPQAVRDDLHPVLEKVNQDGRERADMERDVEGQAAVVPPEEPGNHDQMCAAADGEKFGQALNQTENDGMDEGHQMTRLTQVGDPLGSA